jgi:LysR family transcriptional regulator, hypochlorite-specific transcription factor HypT
VEIRWLQDFLAVAETGNFTRAAALRNTSQAAFSRRIQQLEAWFGVALIDRSILPTQLTPEGEQFRQTASRILADVLDARADLKGIPEKRPDHIRIALPFALATARFPAWWSQWSRELRLTSTLSVGNIHELGIGLLSGSIELMICFHAAQQPVHPEPEQVEAIEIESDFFRPFISPTLLRREGFVLPGEAGKPLPLLMYSSGVYFARLVDLVIEGAGGLAHRTQVIESDMADILRDMAIAGHGIAWLPESTVADCPKDALVPIGGPRWSMPLSIMAFRNRANTNPAVTRLWSLLARARPPNLARSRPNGMLQRGTQDRRRP